MRLPFHLQCRCNYFHCSFPGFAHLLLLLLLLLFVCVLDLQEPPYPLGTWDMHSTHTAGNLHSSFLATLIIDQIIENTTEQVIGASSDRSQKVALSCLVTASCTD
jgi:hypothetical protein